MSNYKITYLSELNDDTTNSNQPNSKLNIPQQPSLNGFSPKTQKNKSNLTLTKTTPMSTKYKFDSFSNLYAQQQSQQNNRTNSPHKGLSQSQLSVSNLGNHHRRPSSFSRHSSEQNNIQTPSNKQIKEYISKNSITGLLGVKQKKKEILDKKTLSQFSRLQENIHKQDITEKEYVLQQQQQQKKLSQVQQLKLEQSEKMDQSQRLDDSKLNKMTLSQKIQYRSNINNIEQDTSMTVTLDKKKNTYEHLLDLEVSKADIFQKWVPKQQTNMTQSVTNPGFKLNLSTLKQQPLQNSETQQINSTSSQVISPRKLKFFKENEDQRKGKDMVKKNQQMLSKHSRKFGTFVEFSKVGPARSIACLQTRIDHLFNKNPNMIQSKLPLQIYSSGSPVASDITSWKVSRPQSSHSFFVGQNVQRQSLFRAKNMVKNLNVELEQETKEQIQQRNFKIRSNLDTVVKNIRNINLTQSNSINLSLNKSNLSMSQYNTISTVQSPKLNFDIFSPRQVSASVSISSPLNFIPTKSDFLSPQNGPNKYRESNFALVQHKDMRDSIKEEENNTTDSSPVASPLTETIISNNTISLQPPFTLNMTNSRFGSITQTPKCFNEDLGKIPHQRSNFASIGNRDDLIHLNQAQEQNNSQQQGSLSQREQHGTFKGRNFYSLSQNNIDISNQRFKQSEIRQKMNSVHEAKNENKKEASKKKASLNGDTIQTFFAKNRPEKRQTKSMSFNQNLNMKAMNKAIVELNDAEYENDKLMFDPNAERIKKKRRIKNKLRKILIKCAKMEIKAKDINTVSIFSTTPYENKGSFAFLECAKKGQNQLVMQLLEKNIYFVSDFDQFGLTALHHACKKGNIHLAQYLVSKGADIDAQDSMKRTPLFYALISENKELIKELLIMKCSPWSGDCFSFLKQNLPEDILRIMQFAKELDVICKIQINVQERQKIWNRQIEFLKSM